MKYAQPEKSFLRRKQYNYCEGAYLRISLKGEVIFYFLGQVREPAGKLLKIEYVVDQR